MLQKVPCAVQQIADDETNDITDHAAAYFVSLHSELNASGRRILDTEHLFENIQYDITGYNKNTYTFQMRGITNAAANELREKITGKLRTLLDSGLQESEKDNVRKALDSMEQMKRQTIWVNGTADLVVRYNDGTVMVYDYKSDSRNGKPLQDFEKALDDKYEGQLALYRYAIGRVFGSDDVKTELIHLYR